MSLLSLCQEAMRHPSLGLPVINSIVGNTASHAPAILQVAKEELDDLAGRCYWQELTREHTFTTTASAVQVTASSFPVDFDRMIPETFFNRTTRRYFNGPISAGEWQNIQAIVSTAVDPQYRIRGGTFLITPTPTTGNTVAYEYITKYKVRSNAGADQITWAADSDTTVFPENVVTLGVVWRYRKGRGYPFNAEQETYERRVADLILRNGNRPRLSTDAPLRFRKPYPPQTPETLNI